MDNLILQAFIAKIQFNIRKFTVKDADKGYPIVKCYLNL